MIMKLLRWLSERVQRPNGCPYAAGDVFSLPAQNEHTRRVDRDVDTLRRQIALSRAHCRILGDALHEGGLEAFAEALPELATQYGMSLTAQDFKAHLCRQQQLHQRRPAAYLVQFCRGGGLH